MSPLACQTEFNTLLFLVFFPCDPSWSLLNFCLQCGSQRGGGKVRPDHNRVGICLPRTAPYSIIVWESVYFIGSQIPAQRSFKSKSSGGRDITQLVEGSPIIQKALGSILSNTKTRCGVVCLWLQWRQGDWKSHDNSSPYIAWAT